MSFQTVLTIHNHAELREGIEIKIYIQTIKTVYRNLSK